MDNDVSTDGLLGSGGGNDTVTTDDIQSDFDFSRNLGVFAGFLFIPAIFMAFLLIPEPDGWIGAICCLAIPTGVMMVAGAPTGFSQDDMSFQPHNEWFISQRNGVIESRWPFFGWIRLET